MLKKVAKIAGLVCLPMLLWVLFVLFYKESLDEGLSDFYRPRQIIPKAQDATVFLNGLAAPAGKDVVEHGLLVARIRAETGADFALAKQKIELLGELGLAFNADELDCWIYGPDKGAKQQPCASAKQVSGLINKHALLLDRYQAMAGLSFVRNSSHNLQLFINLNRLLSAQILLDSRTGKAEAAFRRWKSNFSFLNRAAGSPTGWIERAVVLVSYSFAQTTLEELLHTSPDLAIRHRNELLRLLDGDIDLWRIDEALRGEHAMLERELFSPVTTWSFDANFVRNRIYRTDLLFLNLLRRTQVAHIGTELRYALQQDADWRMHALDYFMNPLSTTIVGPLNQGRWRAGELVLSAWDKVAYNRLLALRIQSAMPGGQGDVAGLVVNSPAELHNPFNDQPMVWIPKQRVLWFAYRGCTTVRQVRLPGGRFLTNEEIAALRSNYPEQCT